MVAITHTTTQPVQLGHGQKVKTPTTDLRVDGNAGQTQAAYSVADIKKPGEMLVETGSQNTEHSTKQGDHYPTYDANVVVQGGKNVWVETADNGNVTRKYMLDRNPYGEALREAENKVDTLVD